MKKEMQEHQFCKRGHDTFVCGRKKNGECKQCHRDDVKQLREEIKQGKRVSKIRKRFCKNGHDTFVVGRDTHQTCNECKKQMDKKYSSTEKGRKVKRNNNLKYIRSEKGKQTIKTYTNSILGKRICRKSKKKYVEKHPEIRSASVLKCQTNRQLRIVAWTDWGKIFEFERHKPKDMAVDHYIPLQGKLVSGLHVSWNLQYLTTIQNSKKGNRINLLEASEWYGKILKEAGLK